jgi:hypothetical protein
MKSFREEYVQLVERFNITYEEQFTPMLHWNSNISSGAAE